MQRKQHDYHFIYKTLNLVNNKFYIGMHSTSNLEDGYIGSGKKLQYSIKKYGRENFKMEIIEFLPDRDSLKEREKEIVNSDLLKEELCMNLQLGGGGGFVNEEHRKKAQRAGALASMKIMRNRYREIQSDTEFSFEKRSEKTRQTNLRETGSTNRWKGRTHSIETKIRMTESKKGHGVGSLNSQYGTCWIKHSDEKSKKIKKYELDSFIKLGWIKGR